MTLRKITTLALAAAAITLLMTVTAFAAGKLAVYDEADVQAPGASIPDFGLNAWDFRVIGNPPTAPSPYEGIFEYSWIKPGVVLTLYYNWTGTAKLEPTLLEGVRFGLGVSQEYKDAKGITGGTSPTSITRGGDLVLDLETHTLQITFEEMFNLEGFNELGLTGEEIIADAIESGYIGNFSLQSEFGSGSSAMVIEIVAVTIGNTEPGLSAPWLDVLEPYGAGDGGETDVTEGGDGGGEVIEPTDTAEPTETDGTDVVAPPPTQAPSTGDGDKNPLTGGDASLMIIFALVSMCGLFIALRVRKAAR